MTAMECGILPPRTRDLLYLHQGRFRDEKVSFSCILPAEACTGRHVFRLPNEELILWEDDYDCGCCEPEDNDRCYTAHTISEDQFRLMLNIGDAREQIEFDFLSDERPV